MNSPVSQPARSANSAVGAPVMLPDTNTISAWAYHDHIVAKARAKAKIEHPESRYIQTALGELVGKMYLNRLFSSMVLTDTILSELFCLTLTSSAVEWKILTRQYGEPFEQQFKRGYLTWFDIKHALIFNPKLLSALPGSTPRMPLIPRKDIEEILVGNYQPAGTWFQFLQRNLAFIDFAQTRAISSEVEGRGESSIVNYIKHPATTPLFGSPERLAYKERTKMQATASSSHVVVTDDIKAFNIFAHTGKEVFVLNSYALVSGLCQAKTAFSAKAGKGANPAIARSIPVPEPREGGTVQAATDYLFTFLAEHMNIQTMSDSYQAHYPVSSKREMSFEAFMMENLRMKGATLR